MATSEILSDTEKLFTSSLAIFIGLICRIVLLGAFEVLAARHLGPANYGSFMVAFTVVILLSTASSLGLQLSLQRLIAFHRERNEFEYVKGLIALGLTWPVLLGLFITGVLYFSADTLAHCLFQNPDVAPLLKVLAFVIPPWSTRSLSISIFSAYKQPLYKVSIEDFIEPLLRFSAISLVTVKQLSAIHLGYGVLIVSLVAALSAWFLVWKGGRKIIPLRTEYKIPWKSVLNFWVPLTISGLVTIAREWINVPMLGILSSVEQAGIFRSASQPPMFITAMLTSFLFIYFPMTSEAYANRDKDSWKKLNNAVARWALSLAFPLSAACVLFPESVIDILFGWEYREGVEVVRILGFTNLIHVGCGFTGVNLIVAGRTKLHMLGKLLILSLHVGLNLIWIPQYGATGSALAWATSIILMNTYNLVCTGWLFGIMPFDKKYLLLLLLHIISVGSLWIMIFLIQVTPVAGLILLCIFELPIAITGAFALGVVSEGDRALVAVLRNRLRKLF